MNTAFLRKNGPVAKHGNKVFNGLSAAALVFLYANFATKEQCKENAQRCEGGSDKCELKRSRQWQKIADLELEVERLKLRSPRATLWDETLDSFADGWVACPGDFIYPPSWDAIEYQP